MPTIVSVAPAGELGDSLDELYGAAFISFIFCMNTTELQSINTSVSTSSKATVLFGMSSFPFLAAEAFFDTLTGALLFAALIFALLFPETADFLAAGFLDFEDLDGDDFFTGEDFLLTADFLAEDFPVFGTAVFLEALFLTVLFLAVFFAGALFLGALFLFVPGDLLLTGAFALLLPLAFFAVARHISLSK